MTNTTNSSINIDLENEIDMNQSISNIEKNSSLVETENKSDAASYVIELERWGITQGTFGKPPYDISEWEIAYNNLLGFNSAIAYAKDNVLPQIIVPKGVYSFCYTNLKGGAEPYLMINTSIKLFNNQTLDLNGSTFEIMYDSINKNPYDNSPTTTPAWKLSGMFIELFNCYNTHVINGIIIGEIPNRSFTDSGVGFASEKGIENTYGVYIQDGSNHCSVQNLDVSMFMGDGIIIGAYPSRLGNWYLRGSGTIAYPGYADVNGVIIQKDGAYISNNFPVIQGEYKVIQMRTGGGYTRIPIISDRTFEYLFYSSSNILITRKKAIYLQKVTIPYSTSYVRIQFTNEVVGLESLDIKYSIAKPQCNHIKISSCIIHDNHRGGISGGADFTLIEHNVIFHNGMDSGLSIPLFPSTTRYSINFEDSYSNYLTIRDNEIYSGFNGLLLGVYHAKVSGNYIAEFGGTATVVYNNANTIISDNVIYNSSPILLQSVVSTQERNIMFSNNVVTCNRLDITTTYKTHVRVLNNMFYLNYLTLDGDINVSNNHFKSYDGRNYKEYSFLKILVSKCTNNIFEDFNYGTHYRFSLIKIDGSSSIKGNIFKSVGFNNLATVNDLEFEDSVFYNCKMECQIKDKTKNSTVTFNNCRLENTNLLIGSTYVNDITTGGVTISVFFNFCNIKITEAATFNTLISIGDNKSKTQLTAGVQPRKYESIFTGCLIENTVTSKLTCLLKYGSSSMEILIPKKVLLEECTLKVTDLTKFNVLYGNTAACVDNISVLKSVTYIGFTSIPKVPYGKLELYNKMFISSDPVPPSSIELQIGTCWFNSITKKPYWWDGLSWRDASGTNV